MAASNFQAHVFLTISLTFFLLLLNNKVSSSDSLSFILTEFTPEQPNLILQGDAVVTSLGKLQLTKVDNGVPLWNSLGRALYATPVHIWDNATGEAASFTTSFSFQIYAPNRSSAADGLAFFLAPVGTQPQGNAGLLGLFPDTTENKAHQIVAVEFDTFLNEDYDPSYRHIGIDVNSIKSTKTGSWGFPNGVVGSALITYQASTQLLAASIVYPSRQSSYIASSTVDLKSVLPEWVTIGFSATTGASESYVETHDIHSWSFTSTYGDVYSSSSDALKDHPHHASLIKEM